MHHHRAANREKSIDLSIRNVFPMLIQIKLNFYSWRRPSVNSYKFHLCNSTPRWKDLIPPRDTLVGHESEDFCVTGWHSLRSERRRYPIVFEPRTFALDREKWACHAPSIQFVLWQLKNATSTVAIRVVCDGTLRFLPRRKRRSI